MRERDIQHPTGAGAVCGEHKRPWGIGLVEGDIRRPVDACSAGDAVYSNGV